MSHTARRTTTLALHCLFMMTHRNTAQLAVSPIALAKVKMVVAIQKGEQSEVLPLYHTKIIQFSLRCSVHGRDAWHIFAMMSSIVKVTATRFISWTFWLGLVSVRCGIWGFQPPLRLYRSCTLQSDPFFVIFICFEANEGRGIETPPP